MAPRERLDKKNLVLIGMPGAGKSTVGVLLAKQLGMAFLDTDIWIQTREQKSLQQIITAIGMAGFCALEEKYILECDVQKHVIATGGSVIYGPKAMAHLKARGMVFYLDTGADVLEERLGNLDQRGVIRTPGQDLTGLYAERHPLYFSHADQIVACGNSSPDQVLQKIVALR